MKKCYLVCGATYPYMPSLWTSKRGAERAAAAIRRKVREAYPSLYPTRLRAPLRIGVELRDLRDMDACYHMRADSTGEYPRRK